MAVPGRFRMPVRHPRRALLVSGGALAAALPAVYANDVSTLMAGALCGGAWLAAFGMTFQARAERPGLEPARRLASFRHAIDAAGPEPSREALERLLATAGELKFAESEVADDLARVRASLEALALREALRAGAWPVSATADALATTDACHFVCPVRFGRRRADQYGHLVLTRSWLTFRGALDMSVAWREISAVERAEREIVVALRESRRMLRFSCHTFDEAARCGVIAAELARLAAEPATQPAPAASPYHAV